MSKASIYGQLRYVGASVPEADRLSLILHLEYWAFGDKEAYARLVEMRLEGARFAKEVMQDRHKRQSAGYLVDMRAPIHWGTSVLGTDGVLVR